MTQPHSRSYHLFETAIGCCGIAWSAAGLVRVQLPEADDLATAARLRHTGAMRNDPSASTHATDSINALQGFFSGQLETFDGLTLDLSIVTPEAAAIYAALRAMPRGTTTTYGQLAAAIGNPGAARVVGRAMARNPWPVIVPCHRVLTAQGRSGGFSAYGGAATQRRLLALEGATIPGEISALPDLFEDMP
jgi:methylated-DNA-[protein]-cysteine S-methyltransferase